VSFNPVTRVVSGSLTTAATTTSPQVKDALADDPYTL